MTACCACLRRSSKDLRWGGSVVHPTMLGQTALTLSKRGQGGPALSRYFFGYNLEADQGVRPERQGQGNIGSVSPARDQNATDPRIVVARIKGVPPPPEKDLDPSRKVHGCIGRRKPDVADVPCAVPGRDIQAAAERERQMGVVTADPALLGVSLSGCAGRARVLVAERDMVVDEVADRLHPHPAGRRRREQPPSLVRQAVGFAVPAAEQKQQRVYGQRLNRMLLGSNIGWVRLA